MISKDILTSNPSNRKIRGVYFLTLLSIFILNTICLTFISQNNDKLIIRKIRDMKQLTDKEANSLQKEIDHILDSVANSIRLLEMIDVFLDRRNQGKSLPIDNVIDPFCDICKSGLKDYPEINRRTCSCGALGYNVKTKHGKY